MLYLVLLLALLTLTLIGLQRYFLAKLRRGFSLYDSDKHQRFKFPDRDEDATRQWLESEGDEPFPSLADPDDKQP